MNVRLIAAISFTALAMIAHAQEKSADTVIIPLAKTSKIIFIMQDRSDLEVLKHYNFQDMFTDVFKKIEDSDTTRRDTTASEPVATNEDTEDWGSANDSDDESQNDEEWEKRKNRIGRTWQSTNVDFGMNNFLSNGKFPDASETYSVRPWGSWFVGVSSVQRTRLGKNFFLEWGLGVNWYNFKFEDDATMIQKDELGAHFVTDTRDVDHMKSKLTATYINATMVPMLDFGDRGRKTRIWEGYRSEFRIGAGPYVGYRIYSKSKLVFEENGDKKKEKEHDSFYLNNIRYGLRLQLGFRSTDMFFNYDLNDLFTEGKGPNVNAISFGFIF
jgi:hypothetical protein